MGVQKIRVGTNEDGTPHFLYQFDESTREVVATGRAAGVIELADGTKYDVTDAFVEVDSREHALELHHHIGVQVEQRGILDTTDPSTGEFIKYRHTDCTHCDAPVTVTK